MKSGNLNFLEPSGPVMGLLYVFTICYSCYNTHVFVCYFVLFCWRIFMLWIIWKMWYRDESAWQKHSSVSKLKGFRHALEVYVQNYIQDTLDCPRIIHWLPCIRMVRDWTMRENLLKLCKALVRVEDWGDCHWNAVLNLTEMAKALYGISHWMNNCLTELCTVNDYELQDMRRFIKVTGNKRKR